MSAHTPAAAAEAIIASLDADPFHWFWRDPDNKYTLTHKSGIEIWITSHSRIYIYKPNKVQFGFWQGVRLRRAYRRWQKRVGNDVAHQLEADTCRYVIAVLATGETPL